MAKRKSNEGYLITYTKATNARAWLLFSVEILLLAAIMVYTGVTCKSYRATKDSIRKLDLQIELLNRDIKLSRTPRLSLGLTEKTKYIEFYEKNEDISESQIDAYFKKADSLGAEEFYYYKNVSPNTAFSVKLILYKRLEKEYSVSCYTISYILPYSKNMDFLIGPLDEERLRGELEETYERDVVSELHENEVFDAYKGNLCYVLLYTDYTNNLFALRRSAVYDSVKGFSFYLPKYYDLGPLEGKDEGGDRE